MFECFLLNAAERKILKLANDEIGALKDHFGDKPDGASKSALMTGYWNHYRSAKEAGKKEDQVETHEFMTARAFDLIGMFEGSLRDDVIRHSMDPDRTPELIAIAAEGHFYGPVDIGGSEYGNYMQRVYLPEVLDEIQKVHDIYENALTNFGKYYDVFAGDRSDTAKLGIAVHYLQDMTAPHHAGNYALFFSRYTDHFDTHLAFEKHAREIVNEYPDRFTATADGLRAGYGRRFDELGPTEFAREINRMIAPFFPMIKKKDKKAWEVAIDGAVPIAIAASAVVLANALSGKREARTVGTGVPKKRKSSSKPAKKKAGTAPSRRR